MKSIKQIIITFFVVVSFAFVFNQSSFSDEFEILSVKDKVEISTDREKWEDVTPPLIIQSGTWIKTGSTASATIVLPNNTQTKIARNSEILLKSKEKKAEVQLTLGKLWSKTNKKSSKLKIKAPNAVASIRGTEWVVEVNADGVSSLAVLEGTIELASTAGESQSIESGSVAEVDKNGKISIAKLVNPEEYLQFVYRYRIEPLAYLPEGLIKNDSSGNILSSLGSGSENITDEDERLIINSIKEGTLPEKHKFIPDGANKLVNLASENNFSEILNFKPNKTWNSEWIEWLNFLKIEVYLASGDDNKATIELSSSPKSFPSNYIKIKQFISKGFLNEAKELSDNLLNSNSSSVHLAFTKGEIEEALGDIEKAYFYYTLAHNISGHWYLPMLRLASVSMTKGRFDESKKWIETAEKNKADITLLASNKAELFSLRNNLTSASKALETLFETGDADFQAYTADGIVMLKKGQPDEALKRFVDATALERNYSRAYSFMAVAHLQSGEHDVALKQLRMAEKLDPNDPLPNIIASQIYSGMMQAESAVDQAEKVKLKSGENRSFGQLANDQQGGANIGRRFLEIGLPGHALESALKTKKVDWAGSYLFDAATAESGLERNSKYIKGFILDSQTFGSRRDSSEIILKPGNYGYKEYNFSAGAEDYDLSYKFGENGRRIENDLEYSYLYDIGVFAVQRDAYYAPDDTDNSYAALGFVGLGWRENYDVNRFFTANVVPFYSESTYPVRDTTLRLDYGASKRTDDHTRMFHMASEFGDASIDIEVSGNCLGKDSQSTSALELAVSELGRTTKYGILDLTAEFATRIAKSDYTVDHPSSGNCTDLAATKGNYSSRTEDIDNREYNFVYTGVLERKLNSGNLSIRGRIFNYQHNFDQNLVLDGTTQTPFVSDADQNNIKPAIGYSLSQGDNVFRIAYIEDYHPLSQASLSVHDTAGIPTRFEFMNPGGKITQMSARFTTDFGKDFRFFSNFDSFEIFNNPIYRVIREQWNADLLENFTLDKYENPNLNDLLNVGSDFAAAEFNTFGFSLEKKFKNKMSYVLGYQNWEGDELNHPNFDQGGIYGRVTELPEQLLYFGFTRSFPRGAISGRIKSEQSLVSTATGTPFDRDTYEIKMVSNLKNRNGQVSYGASGNLADGGDHKLSIKYRLYF